MKRLVCFIACCLLLIGVSSPASADNGDTAVYVTRTGSKYHTYSCRYLSESCIEVTLSAAVNGGYTPCKVCHPPLLSADEPVPTETLTPTHRPLPTFNAAVDAYVPVITTVPPTATPAPTTKRSGSSSSGGTNFAVAFFLHVSLISAAVYFHKKSIEKVRDEERLRAKKLVDDTAARIYKELEDSNYNALYARCKKISETYALPTTECLRQVAHMIAVDRNDKTALPSALIDARAYNIMFCVVGDMLASHKYNLPNGELDPSGNYMMRCLKTFRRDMVHAGYATRDELNDHLECICVLTLSNLPYERREELISAIVYNRG